MYLIVKGRLQLEADRRCHENWFNSVDFVERGVDEVKQEAAHKEVPKVREDKAR